MKKALPIIIVIGIIIAGLGMSYNGLVSANEGVDGSWAQVENQLKRRADLIPNLVNTVKGYASHESEVLTQITEARSKVNSANTVSEHEEANNEMEQALNNLNIVVEAYPELKANDNFIELQAQLEGTENRIATERMRYNEEVEGYNVKVKRFPTNIMAKMFGFSAKPYFEINEADAQVPQVDF